MYKALDETAVFGCSCRHEFPLLFTNLKHGERFVIKLNNDFRILVDYHILFM